jgi:RsiW-degrading membrane proteinase PrsW (M82 family)
VVIRSYAKGVAIGYHRNRQRTKLMLTPIVLAVTMALVNVYYNYAEYMQGPAPDWNGLILGSLLAAMFAGLSSFCILWLIFKASDRRQAKIERALDEDEQSV